MLIGDAAAGVNPLNGEGIDYGLEMGRFAAEMLGGGDLSLAWPSLLQEHYARAFSIARRLAWLLTVPWLLPTVGPFAMRSVAFMQMVVRVMGNLVVDDDVDRVARLWRRLGPGRAPWTAASRSSESHLVLLAVFVEPVRELCLAG